MKTFLAVVILAGLCRAEKVSTQDLIEMARTRTPGLEQALRDTFTAENIQKGAAAVGEMGEFVWAVTSDKGPSLQINDEAPIPAFKAKGRCGWCRLA